VAALPIALKEVLVTLAPDAFYLNDLECLLSVFDLREPGAAEMLSRERALWPRHTEIEILDEVHAAVIRRPGCVSGVAA
jgi:hypothetical protein